ncbi:histidine phosphatase family protein [Algicola sagamiensis]|uniref:histidine phosphatase family protein n=1 Tax=Algicola sagamiensis TaxID=163869 RepID=UPI000688F6F6|nr:histidine phosphatase family protein [Algicola sagamiensis]
MRHIYIVTHGEAEHHVKGLIGGWTDFPLTKLGETQAHQTGEYLATLVDETRAEMHSSDLLRCCQSAQIIYQHTRAHYHLTSELREISFGRLDGKPRCEIQKNDVFPTQEQIQSCQLRIEKYVSYVLEHTKNDLIFITHGYAMNFVLSTVIGQEISADKPFVLATPSSVSCIHDDGVNCKIQQLNQVGHLHAVV